MIIINHKVHQEGSKSTKKPFENFVKKLCALCGKKKNTRFRGHIMKEEPVKFTWKTGYTWVLLLNTLYILLFYYLMNSFT